MNGGYILVDFTGVDLSNLGTKPGAYDEISEALKTEKPVVIHGIVNGAQAFTDIVAYGGFENSTSVFLSFFPVTLHISNEDVISM